MTIGRVKLNCCPWGLIFLMKLVILIFSLDLFENQRESLKFFQSKHTKMHVNITSAGKNLTNSYQSTSELII